MTLFLFLISWPSGDKNQRLQLIVQAENPWRAYEISRADRPDLLRNVFSSRLRAAVGWVPYEAVHVSLISLDAPDKAGVVEMVHGVDHENKVRSDKDIAGCIRPLFYAERVS